jgi:hypothetical protein
MAMVDAAFVNGANVRGNSVVIYVYIYLCLKTIHALIKLDLISYIYIYIYIYSPEEDLERIEIPFISHPSASVETDPI